MVRLIPIILVVAVVVWLTREFIHANRRRRFLSTRDSRGRPMLPPHQRVSDEQLQRRAAELRKAVSSGAVTRDEAVGSLIRYAGGALTPEAARTLLD